MEKLYIVDAVNFLFRSYYAIGPMTNAQRRIDQCALWIYPLDL